jgi:hypothetical protein
MFLFAMYQPMTDTLCILNTNKLRAIIQALVRRTTMHPQTYLQTEREREHSKSQFFVNRAAANVNASKSGYRFVSPSQTFS